MSWAPRAVAVPPSSDGRLATLGAIASLCALAAALWAVDRLLPGVDGLTRLGRAWLSADPWLGASEFLLAGAALTAVGLPRQSVSLVGGYLFGVLAGTLLALAATLAGCAIAYHVARGLGAGALERRLPALASRLHGWTRDRVFAKTLMVRLFPVGSNVATNLAAGAARARRFPFFAGSLVGFAPQTLVFALAGTSVGTGTAAPLLVGIALLGASAGIAAWLARTGRVRGGG